ncbi:MAG: DUF177 domain-containing protein [Acidobacteriaceae bacterium]
MTATAHGPRLNHVLITPLQLEHEPLLFDEPIPSGALDYAPDVSQVGPLPVTGRADLIVESRGHGEQVADIRLRAAYHGDFELLCARCVEPVPTSLAGDFDLIFRPQSADADPAERSITPDETEIGYYEESGLSLEDVVREQVLLSLPSRTLCKEDCKGLCPRCGQNLNLTPCSCNSVSEAETNASGWNALAGLAGTIKPG